MTVLALEIKTRGHNKWTVAMSLAANRASKIELLLGDNTSRCNRIAARFSDHLERDVETFLAKHKHEPYQAHNLWCAATVDMRRVERLRSLPRRPATNVLNRKGV